MSDQKTEELVYITVEGIRVPYKPISFLKQGLIKEGIEMDYAERGEPINPPKIDAKVLGGETIEIALNENNLEAEGNEIETMLRKQLWEKHTEAVTRMEKEIKDAQNDLLMSAILVDLPEDETWIAEQKKLRIRVPDDLDKRKQHYIQTEVLTTLEDIVEINALIFTKSAVRNANAEDLAVAKESFRRKIFGVFEESITQGDGTKETENATQENGMDA